MPRASWMSVNTNAVSSPGATAMLLPSGLQATVLTLLPPRKTSGGEVPSTSHTRTVLSFPDVAIHLPLGLHAAELPQS